MPTGTGLPLCHEYICRGGSCQEHRGIMFLMAIPVALCLRNSGSQTPDCWLKLDRNTQLFYAYCQTHHKVQKKKMLPSEVYHPETIFSTVFICSAVFFASTFCLSTFIFYPSPLPPMRTLLSLLLFYHYIRSTLLSPCIKSEVLISGVVGTSFRALILNVYLLV